MHDREHRRDRNGLARLVSGLSSTGKTLLLLVAIGSGGVTIGVFLDHLMGIPARVDTLEADVHLLDSSYAAVLAQRDSTSARFRLEVLAAFDSLRTEFRTYACYESTTERDAFVHCLEEGVRR